jgi:hypothetical protein
MNYHFKVDAMMRDERVKALREMDDLIEQTERACQQYELLHMEMLAAIARAKAIHKRLLANKAELMRDFGERSG